MSLFSYRFYNLSQDVLGHILPGLYGPFPIFIDTITKLVRQAVFNGKCSILTKFQWF